MLKAACVNYFCGEVLSVDRKFRNDPFLGCEVRDDFVPSTGKIIHLCGEAVKNVDKLHRRTHVCLTANSHTRICKFHIHPAVITMHHLSGAACVCVCAGGAHFGAFIQRWSFIQAEEEAFPANLIPSIAQTGINISLLKWEWRSVDKWVSICTTLLSPEPDHQILDLHLLQDGAAVWRGAAWWQPPATNISKDFNSVLEEIHRQESNSSDSTTRNSTRARTSGRSGAITVPSPEKWPVVRLESQIQCSLKAKG